MRLIFTGKGTSGSWACRGQQLGAAMGATVLPMATKQDIAAHDVAVVVKRTPKPLLDALHASGTPWAFDVVDFYSQPCQWKRGEAIRWVQAKIKECDPTAVIWPNMKMRQDCDTGLPGFVFPHHHRPGIAANPVRENLSAVGYEGSEKYLDAWRAPLEVECAKRGWRFVVNPPSLADLDICVAFRGGQWSGYVPSAWKSNVKLANAHGSGTPFIGQPEAGYLETATGCEYWAEHPKDLATCFDWLADQSARQVIHDKFRAAAFPVEHAARELKSFLNGL